jgi:hypothetical protein
MENFMAQTESNFATLRASTREDMATLNNTLGDQIDSLRTNTSGCLDTLDARLIKMEEHGLTTNQTLSMLERNINQNNQEIEPYQRS